MKIENIRILFESFGYKIDDELLEEDTFILESPEGFIATYTQDEDSFYLNAVVASVDEVKNRAAFNELVLASHFSTLPTSAVCTFVIEDVPHYCVFASAPIGAHSSRDAMEAYLANIFSSAQELAEQISEI